MRGACPIEAENAWPPALSSDVRPPGREFIEGPEKLYGQFTIQFAHLLRLGEEVGIGLPCELALNLDRLVERTRRDQPFDKEAVRLPGVPCVVAVGLDNGLQADRIQGRHGVADTGRKHFAAQGHLGGFLNGFLPSCHCERLGFGRRDDRGRHNGAFLILIRPFSIGLFLTGPWGGLLLAFLVPLIGFTVAYFLAFHVRSKTWQIVLTLLCTIPFWTSNVIRMIAWIPLLGRNGLVNQGLQGVGLINQPLEWLLFSEFSVVLALVHLFTFFMVVPIFNSMIRIDKKLIEAAYDAGATGWQTLVNVIIPLAKPGIVIGSIFVITIVMGDFVTIGVMGGQQIASAGKIIEARLNALQFPAAAANAVILLGITILIISALTRIVDIRKEL